MGGLVTDDNARVLDDDSNPIPGLFAVGNVQGGRFVEDYPFTLSGASHAAALSLWVPDRQDISLNRRKFRTSESGAPASLPDAPNGGTLPHKTENPTAPRAKGSPSGRSARYTRGPRRPLRYLGAF